MQSPIYWHPKLYKTAMKLSYQDKYEVRYEALLRHISNQGHLLELCMGDSYFYLNYLSQKNIRYTCADINPVFVNHAQKKGLKAELLDLATDEIPEADHILLQASLYHFIPNEGAMIARFLKACRQRLIISESIDNLSNAPGPIRSRIGEYLSKAKTGQSKVKFTSQTLRQAFSPFEKNMKVWEESPANREVIIVLEK